MSQRLRPAARDSRPARLLYIFAAAIGALFLSGHVTIRAEDAACLPPIGNAIVCENLLPGSPASEWEVAANGGDDSIQGFATDISVARGGTIQFKVDTDATTYHIDIYRIGYYGGMGARKVATVTPSATLPQNQPPCLSDVTTGLVDCGNWAVSASWAVPATATSGIYIGKLVRPDLGDASHMVFVVRDDTSHADILLQTSDTTWQAYNDYGGNSLYTGSPAGRAYKVSYNRPFVVRSNPYKRTWLFADEYPMVRWLEANGYSISYTTGVDTDRRGAELLEHKMFLSSGHDEYWSGAQRANVEAARAAGVHLAFFSGNEVFWKTRWENGIDASAAPYRTLVTYKNTLANEWLDPSSVWTGTWRDARFSPPGDGGRPENSLTGTIFMGNCCAALPLTVSSAQGRLRFWRNTSLASLAAGTSSTFAPGIVGYEFDADLDNGSRPSGLMRLSTSNFNYSSTLLDEGAAYGPGQITHALTLYRHPSGALVFGAGTNRWSWALDTHHDEDEATPDIMLSTEPIIQQATVNLLADMSVQPLTLQPGLSLSVTSNDTIAPTSTITSPQAGTVPPSSAVVISGTAADNAGGQVSAVEVSVDGGSSWKRATGLSNWTYNWGTGPAHTAILLSRAVDDSGNMGQPSSSVTVTVGGTVTCPCTIWPSYQLPAVAANQDSAALELGVKFQTDTAGMITGIRYFKSDQNVGVHTGSLWTASGTLLRTATFTSETANGWQQVQFDSPVPVSANTTYVASYHTDSGYYSGDLNYFATEGFDNGPLHALSQAASGGNGLFRYGATAFPNESYGATNYWVDVVFQSTTGPDTTPPTVARTVPTAGSTDFSRSLPLSVTFNESMGAGTVSNTTFQLRDAASALVPSTVTHVGGSDTATLQPNVTLTPAASYTATVKGGASGVKDHAGNPMSADYTWSFIVTTQGYSIWPSTAVPNVVNINDGNALELGLKFRTSVNGFISGIRFYKGSANTGVHTGSLWTLTGTLMSTVTFTNESASGWQQATLPTPVAVTANTTYVVSYHSPLGIYSGNSAAFASVGVVNGPLEALSNSAAAGNGVYRYGTTGFPTETFNSANYWVDVVFDTSIGADTTAPTVTGRTPAPGATGVAAGTAITAAFSENISASTLTGATFKVTDAAGIVLPAVVSYSSSTYTATLQPNAALAQATTYTVRLTGGSAGIKDIAGNALAADVAWSFTVLAAPTFNCPCSIWSPTQAPSQTANDPSAVELGVKFRAVQNGFISGIRFYKSAQNVGTHLGNLWTANGTLVASVTFVGESESGWQQAMFSTPVFITANTTYVASYHTGTGFYSADGAYFGAATTNGPLQALANGTDGANGVFGYGASAFPTGSFNSANYWVDVIFDTTSSDPPSAMLDKTAADFAGGSGDSGVYIAETADGELMLAPAVGAEFSGTTLPAGWSTTPWNEGSTAAVSGGRVTVDGARVSLDNLLPPGQSLEFVATFSVDTSQHAGFAVTLNENLWAVFSSTGNGLHALTHDGAAPTDTFIPGSWLGSPHRFRIDWTAATIAFWIDGNQVASVPAAISGMRPTVSDFNPGNGAIQVDWMRLTPFATAGTFTSRVLNAGATIAWSSAAWTAQVPAGATLTMSARFGNTPVPDASWTSFATLPVNGGSPGVTSQYVQYRAAMGGNGAVTPVVQDVSFVGPAAPPIITVADVSVIEGAAGATNAVFVLSLSRPTVSQVTVAYSTANGTASGSDYTAVAGTAVFVPGATSVEVNFSVTGDAAIEPDETFFLNLGAVSNAVVGDAQAVATIVNDDFPTMSINTASVTEGNTGSVPATFTVTLSQAFTQAVTAAYATANATATADSDYTPAAGTVTFAPGTTTQTIAVPVLGDALDEANETFTVTLSGAVNATITTGQGVGTILDNDPTPSIAISNVSVAEGSSGTSSGSLIATLSAASGLTVTVNYATANGTATAGSDYVAGSGTVTFAPGVTSAPIAIAIVGDTTYESDQTVLVNLSSATNATIADAQGILTITNDDLPVLTVDSDSVTEGNFSSVTATFTVTLTPASSQTVTVAYATANGTATSGSDYTAASGTLSFSPGTTTRTVNVSVSPDSLDEANETFTLNLSNPVNAAITTAQGTGTIVDNDSAPSISIGNASVTEGNTGTKTGSLAVTLSTASGQTVTVNYATANGSATAGSDYVAGTGTLTFAAGVTSQSVVVTLNGDALGESDETVLVNLSSAANASINDSQGTLTITNDDPPSINIDSDSVTEGNSSSATATFTVSLTTASTQTVTVAYATANGTATAGIDYTATSGTLSFSPGTTTRTFNVTVLGDNLDEANETFVVNLTNPVNGTLGTAQGIGTITDNDSAPSISIGNASVTEGNTGTKTGSLAVTLSTASGQTVTVNYATANGSATAGSDYVAATGTLTFAAGVTSQSVVVTVNGDTSGESDETVLVNLSSAANASINDSQGTLSVTNDDVLPSITIGDVSITEGNSGTKLVTLTLTLTPTSIQTVTVDFATANGSASSSSDYVAKSGTVTFAAGTTTGSITVTINGNTTVEANETFLVNLSSPSGATLARTAATVTILNDD